MPSSLLFIIASLIWGSTFWAITQQLGEVAPAVSVAYRFWPRFNHAVCMVLDTQRSLAALMENTRLVGIARLFYICAELSVHLFIRAVFGIGLGRGFIRLDGDLVADYGKNFLSKTIDLAHMGRSFCFNYGCDFIIFPCAQK